MNISFTLLFLLFFLDTEPGQNHTLYFHPLYNQESLRISEEGHYRGNSDSIGFETFKWYVSGIRLLHQGKTVWTESHSFHLLDAAKPASLQFALHLPEHIAYDTLVFNLGIDSLTSVSGIMEGDLDPLQGMYWAWQSGYINLKLEGKSARIAHAHHEFQFHLGGYLSPYNALQEIRLAISPGPATHIGVELKRFFEGLDLSGFNHIMSPGANAVRLSEKAAGMFFILP